MPDRTLNWGDPADAGTKYRTQDDDPAGGGNFVVAEDLDGNTVLLQYNPTAGQWEYGGPVDMGSNNISNVGTISADALEAVDTTTTGETIKKSTSQSVSSNTITYNASFIKLDSEDGNADNLDKIDNFSDGAEVELTALFDVPNITVRHRAVGTDNRILLDGGTDFSLDDPGDRITLKYDSSTPGWCEVSRSNNP